MAIQDPVLLRAGPAQRALHFQEGRASGQVGKPRCRETASCLQSLSALTAWPETGGGPRRPARGASRLGRSCAWPAALMEAQNPAPHS